MLAFRIAEIVFPMFAIISVGAAYASFFQPSMESANRINLDVFVPALVFSALSDKTFELQMYGKLALGGATVILLSGLIVWLALMRTTIQPKTLVPPIMFHNAGNMGLPLLVLAFGNEALPAALVLFLLGNVTHFGIGTYILDYRTQLWHVFKQPAIIAAALAIIVSLSKTTIPTTIALPIDMLGKIAVPLMLFSLGVKLISADLSEWKIGLLGAIISPLSGVLLAWMFLQFVELPPIQAGCLFLFGVLPPAVMNFLFAERYCQEPAKVASIVVLGNLLSVVTLPLALAYALPRFS